MTDRSPYAPLLERVPVRRTGLELRGSRAHVWDYGPEDASQVVVFLHGLRGDHHGLEPVIAHLDGDVRVVVPDLPGFGQSPPMPADAHDVAGYAAWTRELLAAVAPGGDAVLAGHSFGSIVAAAALAPPAGIPATPPQDTTPWNDTAGSSPPDGTTPARPSDAPRSAAPHDSTRPHDTPSSPGTAGSRAPGGTTPGRPGTATAPVPPTDDAAPPVRGLVLVNPIATSALAGPRVVMTRVTVLYHQLAAALPERVGTALLRNPAATRVASLAMATTPDRALRRWIHAEHDRYFNTFADRRVLLEAFHASVGNDVAEFAGAIGVPTLLVAAERDDIAPPAAQLALESRFADARLVMIADTGHLAHYEAPAAVAHAITGFLGALRS